LKYGIYKNYVKRPVDIFLSATFLVVTSPLLLIAVVLILLDDGRPVLFVQERLGQHGNIFRVYKFRSMINRPRNVSSKGPEEPPDDEITPVGKWLRRFRIDEIPQMMNVLQGDMSLVGPRPCLPDLQEDFDENGGKRLLVKPGCTGLAQVHGNNNLSWQERWKYDAHYVENISFVRDVKIITMTLMMIVMGQAHFTTPYAKFISNEKGK
jgi:undecaprenyl phosphate N,N'-diacetylbacillosamine 1-phosphate transferase